MSTNKTQDYFIIFCSFIFMNYILPFGFSYFIKIVGNTDKWFSKNGFEDVEEELIDVSNNLKEVYKKRYLLLKELEEKHFCCIIKIYKSFYKEYLDRHLLYWITKYSNLKILRDTFDNIEVIERITMIEPSIVDITESELNNVELKIEEN
jgi:hypothetical protein